MYNQDFTARLQLLVNSKVDRIFSSKRSRIQPGPDRLDRSVMTSQNTHGALEGEDTNEKSRFVENTTPRSSPFPFSKRPQGVREVIKMYSLYQHHEPSSSLSKLVYDGDVQRIKGCLDNVTARELDAVDRNGFSALHYAAQLNRVEILNMLINSGAIIDNVAENTMTPLHVACRYQI